MYVLIAVHSLCFCRLSTGEYTHASSARGRIRVHVGGGASGEVHMEGCMWRGACGGVQVEGCRWRGHVGWRDEMCMWTWICAFDHGFDHLISPHLRTLLISDDICEFLQRIIEHCVE